MAVTNPNKNQKQLAFNQPIAPIAPIPQNRPPQPVQQLAPQARKIDFPRPGFTNSAPAPGGRTTHFPGGNYIGSKSASVPAGGKTLGTQPSPYGPAPAYNPSSYNPPAQLPYVPQLPPLSQHGQTIWNAVNGLLPYPQYDLGNPQGDAVGRIQALNALSGKGINVPQYDPVTGYILNAQGGPDPYMSLSDYLRTPAATEGYSKPSQQQNAFSLSPGQGFNSSVGVFGPGGASVPGGTNFAGGNMNGMNTVQGQGLPGGPARIGNQIYGMQDLINNPALQSSALGMGYNPPQSTLSQRTNFQRPQPTLSNILKKRTIDTRSTMENNNNTGLDPSFLNWLLPMLQGT